MDDLIFTIRITQEDKKALLNAIDVLRDSDIDEWDTALDKILAIAAIQKLTGRP